MRKALSLILAVVMVALMIPFAVFMTSAAETKSLIHMDESKYSPIYSINFKELTSPAELAEKGWSASDVDSLACTDEGIQYNMSSTSYLALNAVEFNSADNYVVEFTTKMLSLNKRLVMAFADAPVVNASDDANWCLRDESDKSKSNAGLLWKGAAFYTDATYSEAAGTSKLSELDAAAYEAALANADVTLKIFVTAGTANYVVMSVEGFGDYYVYDAAVAFGKTFFFAGRDSVGDTRYVVLQNLTVYSLPYYQNWDFTTLEANDGSSNITAGLPAGWIANDDTEGTRKTTISDLGVTLGGADQAIGMTDASAVPAGIIDGTTDYTLTVKWNTSHKFALIRFGWSGGASHTVDTLRPSNHLAYNVTGGPKNAQQWSDGGSKAGNFGVNGSTWSTEIYNGDTKIDAAAARDYHLGGLTNGSQFTTTFEVVGGKVVAIYNEVDGTTLKYIPAAEYVAKGYFSVWITNWGGNNTANIQSVAIEEGAYVPAASAPSKNLVLPSDWTISADNNKGIANYTDENGVTLGSTQQHIQMNSKVGVGTKRVIAIDYGVRTRVDVMRISWEANAGDAQSYSWDLGSDFDLCILGGPTSKVTKDAVSQTKMSNASNSYFWGALAADDSRIVTVTKTYVKSGELTTETFTCRSWDVMGKTDIVSAYYDGAVYGTGTQYILYIDIDENNKITAINHKLVYHDRNGNFVSETVITTPIHEEKQNVIVCDGYLTIGHNGFGDTGALVVKAVDINAGTYADMGTSLYSVDFGTYAVVSETEITKGETSYRNEEGVEGIRFTTTFDAADLQTLTDLYEAGKVTKVEMGTLITTSAWADAAGAVTFEALDAIKGDKNAYVEVMATIGDFYDVDTFAGTITEVNAEREYCAVGFARVTLANGKVVVVYSGVNTATLADVKPAA